MASAYVTTLEAEASLLSLWPLGADSGTAASDIFGTKPGVYHGTPSLNQQPGPIAGDAAGYVALVAASLQYVSVATPNQPASVSYEIWVNASTWTDVGAIGQWNTNGALLYLESGSGCQLFINAGALTVAPNASLNTGWHQFGIGYDGTNGDVVVDGVVKATGPLAGPITYAGLFCIGQYGAPSGTYLTGGMAMGSHYNARLSSASWAAHFAAAQVGSTVYVPIVKRLRNPLNIHGGRDAEPWIYRTVYEPVPAGWVN